MSYAESWGADTLCTFKISFDMILKVLKVHDNMQDSNARGFIQTMLKFEFVNGCYNLLCLLPTIFKGLT